MRYGTYPYNLEQLLKFDLVNKNIKKSKLQAEHNRICTDAQLHLQTLHNLTGNRCANNSSTDLAHRKVAYLFNILHEDGKKDLSKEIAIQCWSCFYFENKNETSNNLSGSIRFGEALYPLCKQCAYPDVGDKIAQHDPQATGFFHKKADTTDCISICKRTEFDTLNLYYNGKALTKEKFQSLDTKSKNEILQHAIENEYKLMDLLI